MPWKDKEYHKAYFKAYYQRNKEKVKVTSAEYRAAHPELVKEKLRNYRKESKLKMIAYKGSKCILCGYDKHHGALEFHHVDPKQKDTALSLKRALNEENKAELDKCVLLCANCHREVHAGLVSLPVL